ncbi:putative Histidine kinase [uncultured Desulfatiglans sp.]|nr:putative Histidine kinase [uncultured Desulfatiglans sp.]
MDATRFLEPILDKIHDAELRSEIEAGIVRHICELQRSNQEMRSKIAEQQHSLAALEANEQKFRNIFEGVSDLLFFHDLDGRISDVNPAWKKVCGYDRHQLCGMNIQAFMPKDVAPKFTEYLASVKQKGAAVGLFRIKDKAGLEHILEYKTSLARDAAEVPIGMKGSARDITDELAAKAALKESERRLSALLDAITETAVLFDCNGILLAANDVACRRVGRPLQELKGKRISDFFSPEVAARRWNTAKKVIETGSPVREEDQRGGRIFDSHWFPIPGADGSVKQIAVFATDITDARHAENERIRGEKLESLRMMAAGIAHDFNNLLTGVLGFLELASMSGGGGSNLSEHLDRAKVNCLRAVQLTQRFLNLSKDAAPRKQRGALEPIIRDYSSLVLAGSQALCRIDVDQDLWPVAFDEVQIADVLTAVLTNAKEAMSGGGTIEIAVRNTPLGPKRAPASHYDPHAPYVAIQIRDEGVGIPPEHLPKLFDPYFSTKSRGTQKGMGLGLATSYAVIRNHGGFIDVQSVVGLGTTVAIYLPAAVETPQEAAPHIQSPRVAEEALPREPAATSGQGRILVMDDEEMILDVLEQMLTLAGYQPVTAGNGEEALLLFKQARTDGEPFDAVLLDLTVRGGMGGKETLEALLKIDPGIKAIVSSGYVEDPVVKHYQDFGFSAAAAKPYDLKNLERTLADILAQPSKQGTNPANP